MPAAVTPARRGASAPVRGAPAGWDAGRPFGLDAATTAMVSAPAGRTRELVSACAATGGGLLTLGLTQRWGTRLLDLLVPPLLAVVPDVTGGRAQLDESRRGSGLGVRENSGMSYDLAVWEGDRPTNDDDAAAEFDALYARFVESEESVEPTARIVAYVAALLDRYPDIDTDAGEDSPWSTGPLSSEASGPLVYFPMVWSRCDEVSA